MYGVGHNEELLSKAFSDRWDKVTVATGLPGPRAIPRKLHEPAREPWSAQ